MAFRLEFSEFCEEEEKFAHLQIMRLDFSVIIEGLELFFVEIGDADGSEFAKSIVFF